MDDFIGPFLRKITLSKSQRLLNGLSPNCQDELDKLVVTVKKYPKVVNSRGGPRNGTILHRCARNNRVDMVQFLLEKGAEQRLDIHGNYPLHYACISGNMEIVQILLNSSTKVDIETPNFEGERPVHLAAGCGNLEVVELLLRLGAKGTGGYRGNTVLHSAAEKCRIEVVEKLLRLGYGVNVENDHGETPLHLAARHNSGMKCVKQLIKAGANVSLVTKDGQGPAHFAAEAGSLEVMKYLINIGAPLKTEKNYQSKNLKRSVSGQNNNNSLLKLVALSGCSKKGTFLLDKIMAAKNKHDRCTNLADVCNLGHGSYIEHELSEQETDLVVLSQELAENPDHSNSIFNTFLKNNPESLMALFDRCLIYDEEGKKGASEANVVFDFFLFKTSGPSGNELDLIEIIFASGRKRLLEHPLFEVFLRMKWLQAKPMFTVFFLIFLSHFSCMLAFSLTRFSRDPEAQHYAPYIKYGLYGTTTLFALAETMIIMYLIYSMVENYMSKCTKSSISRSRRILEVLNILLATLSWMCGVAVLVTESRNITAVALIWTSHVFMAAVTSIPRIGKNVFLTTQVTYTILEFLFSYLGEIFAFVVAFHILLPDSESFGNIGDGILKILTMLLGEFDFMDMIVRDPDNFWLTKLLFALFLVLMSVVLMNLVIGLAISDIGSLRKEARAYNLRYSTVFLQILSFESKILAVIPCLRNISSDLITQRILNFKDKVYLKLCSLDTLGSSQSLLHVCKGGQMTRTQCPRRVIAAVAQIINDRRDKLCSQEEPSIAKVLKEICILRERLDNMQGLLELSQL